ncbi:hypothetical protein ACXR2U_13545 [Jatrophihabitans sp. YIM 134969]
MSIEFVDADEEPPAVPVGVQDTAEPRRRTGPGRWLFAAATAVAAVLVGVAMLVPLYAVDRTAFVVDFDATTTQDARVPYDAFGHSRTVPLRPSSPAFLTPGDQPYTSVLSVSLDRGVSYGPWWLGLGGALLLVAVAAVVRPRLSALAAVVAALGAALLGSVGAAWLAIRATSDDSIPLIRFQAHPDIGLWLLVVAGALATLAGLLTAAHPPLRRLLPRRHA